MENTASHSSCISRPASASAGESSWAVHFAGFLASSAPSNQDMDREKGGGAGACESSFSFGFSYSFDSSRDHDDPFIIPGDDNDEDDSLQDTACSSAAGPKVATMNDMSTKSMVTMGAEATNTSRLAKCILDAGSRQQVNGAVQEVIGGDNNKGKQLHDLTDLRKKGLCLVPISMLIDYIG